MVARLVQAAREAQQRAYCPYSKFRVGAAILTDRNRIVPGCNVENVSYGLTICAERTAMTRCVIEQAGAPIAIVVAGDTEDPRTPCGACRLFLAEFNPEMLVICVGKNDSRSEALISQLLPSAFNSVGLASAGKNT
ncbi:cytidine deaminase [Candidatus Poribacteria bacterium]|nr:cytidine deaminase [Candidatus Poribacteria bacterium]